MKTSHEIEQLVMEAIAQHAGEVDSAHAPLELDSFTLIELIERLERSLGVVIGPSDMQPEHFTDAASIAALLARKQAAR